MEEVGHRLINVEAHIVRIVKSKSSGFWRRVIMW